MKQSTHRILTTHVGSLPRPAYLIELHREKAPADKLETRLSRAVAEVVKRQKESGIDIVNDGEYGKPMSDEVDYGAWATYVYDRLSGFEMRELPAGANRFSFIMAKSKDRADFAEFYDSGESGIGARQRVTQFPVNVGAI
ncbi:MAG: epoxyalkane--coenzyme M transferase, partial [Acidobacteriia bacterium]|nr:epoxyalkane--coenzyme M transferase [Terriglobia bacterium]